MVNVNRIAPKRPRVSILGTQGRYSIAHLFPHIHISAPAVVFAGLAPPAHVLRPENWGIVVLQQPFMDEIIRHIADFHALIVLNFPVKDRTVCGPAVAAGRVQLGGVQLPEDVLGFLNREGHLIGWEILHLLHLSQSLVVVLTHRNIDPLPYRNIVLIGNIVVLPAPILEGNATVDVVRAQVLGPAVSLGVKDLAGPVEG